METFYVDPPTIILPVLLTTADWNGRGMIDTTPFPRLKENPMQTLWLHGSSTIRAEMTEKDEFLLGRLSSPFLLSIASQKCCETDQRWTPHSSEYDPFEHLTARLFV